MRELITLGPWLDASLTEHIVTERNLARNTRTSYRDTFSLLPVHRRQVRKPVDRLAVLRSDVRTSASVPSRISRMSAAAPPAPAISGSPLSAHSPASLAAAIRPRSNGAVTSGPSRRRVRRARRVADQAGNGGHARRARPHDCTGP